MLTVACVLRGGGIYDPGWVRRLKAGVETYLPIKHRFVCLSDVDVPCERIPLAFGWPGWWAKLELFALRGPVLYLDLDTLPVGDLSDIAAAASKHPLIMLRDFYRATLYGSGVMAWKGSLEPLFLSFRERPEHFMGEYGDRGDQAFIEDWAPHITAWQVIAPGQVASYKADHVEAWNGDVGNTRLICLHGKPKFPQMPLTSWVRGAWERRG